jgi:NAD(P)-dependent dehydrogenase (short-subunit alcohol dehydrogenase family)
VANTTRDVHERLLRTNYLGPALLTRALLPSMLERGGGHFVVISSLSGKYGGPLLAAYAASKHALHGFFESLRAEEHERGIVVTFIVPGFIKTDTAHALTGSAAASGACSRSTERHGPDGHRRTFRVAPPAAGGAGRWAEV